MPTKPNPPIGKPADKSKVVISFTLKHVIIIIAVALLPSMFIVGVLVGMS